MSPTSDALVRLVWTQVWQLTVVAIVIGMLVKLVGGRRPHLAYILWMVVLVKGLTPPLWSSPTSVFSWTTSAAVSRIAVEPIRRPAKPSALLNAAQTSGTPFAVESRAPFEATANAETHTAQPPAEEVAARREPPPVASVSRESALPGTLGIVWLAGAVAYAACATTAVIRLGRLIHRSRVPAEPRLTKLLEVLSDRLRLRQRVRLAIVDAAVGPLAFGWLRPTIVLPRVLAEKSDEDLEPVLAHELLHVRRGDALVGLLQVVLQSLWWFHPLVWWTNRGLCFERERCCDEGVVAELAYEPSRYGRSLLGVLDLKRQLRLPAAIPGIRSFEVTRARLEYLINHSRFFRRRTPRRYWLALALVLMLVLPGAGLSRLEMQAPAAAAQSQAKEPAQPDKESSAPKAAEVTNTWTVQGRVVDHGGAPVADAEVLLLGEERILVDANNRSWFVRRTEQGQMPKPLSTRTDSGGEFRIERTDSAADRLAVIATDPLFWVVPREKLPVKSDVEIKLPESGNLVITCDLPGKPAEQPIHIELKSLDGEHWNGDVLRFDFGSYSIKNPGETVFEHLTPGQYAVQRNQSTRTGEREELITFADRQLVKVVANDRARVSIERKVGRPITGQVRGLEDVELRHAHVSINYFGPEEEPGDDGKRRRYNTAFDVIPITSEGTFTTDPIPPGDYRLELWAMHSTTSNQSPQQSDFEGRLRFTIPEEGELPKLEVKARPRRDRKSASTPRKEDGPVLRVLNAQGKPIPKFELMVWTADQGSSIWLIGSEGRIAQNRPLWGFEESPAIDLTVRADGYASTFAHFGGAEREKLLRGEATLVMHQGEEVQVRFNLPPGVSWPADTRPELYFDDLKQKIRMMWQPSNRRAYAETGLPDQNMLGARTAEDGTTTLRVAPESAPFRVAIYAPGFLRYFERGPFTLVDVRDGAIGVDVSPPAGLDVVFDLGGHKPEELPFDAAAIAALWKVPGGGGSYYSVTDNTAATDAGESLSRTLKVTDLVAGEYLVSVRTKARPGVPNLPGDDMRPINPGVFHASQTVSLKTGQTERVDLAYTPLNSAAFRGDRTAVVRILKADDSPAAGQLVTVKYHDGHYGGLEVFSDSVPADGQITLDGLTGYKGPGLPVGPYQISIDQQHLAYFGFTGDAPTEEFTFRVPPVAGDMAPNVELVNVATGARTRLGDLRGKVVCLEFWAAWCGPCREPMRKLNELAVTKDDAWRDRVAVVPVSIDTSLDMVKKDVAQRGLTNLQHYWSGSNETDLWNSPAAQAFAVSGVPTAFVIGRDGRILWRGHPLVDPDGKDLAARVDAATE